MLWLRTVQLNAKLTTANYSPECVLCVCVSSSHMTLPPSAPDSIYVLLVFPRCSSLGLLTFVCSFCRIKLMKHVKMSHQLTVSHRESLNLQSFFTTYKHNLCERKVTQPVDSQTFSHLSVQESFSCRQLRRGEQPHKCANTHMHSLSWGMQRQGQEVQTKVL